MRRVQPRTRFPAFRLSRANPAIVEIAMSIAVACTAGLLLDVIRSGEARGAALSPAHYEAAMPAPLA